VKCAPRTYQIEVTISAANVTFDIGSEVDQFAVYAMCGQV
jgi:hypothetical protein